MRSVKSLLLTLICAGVILGAGYLGIIEGGQHILKSESFPEKAEYKNTSSGIFYGKIEDDIEIYPWNYYTEEGVGLEKGCPAFLMDEFFIEQYMETGNVSYNEEPEPEAEAADWYFGQLIAYEADVEFSQVWSWFQNSQRHIVEHMVMKEDAMTGSIYFYRDVIKLGKNAYQVQIACSDWNVISFICTAYEQRNKRDSEEWREGKEKLVSSLEQSEEYLSELYTYMMELYYVGAPSIYFINQQYENAYLPGISWLEDILRENGGYVSFQKHVQAQKNSMAMVNEKEKYIFDDSEEEENEADYYYQVVELKDMILLLVQGQNTLGIYYDPIHQRVCGYSYFNES